MRFIKRIYHDIKMRILFNLHHHGVEKMKQYRDVSDSKKWEKWDNRTSLYMKAINDELNKCWH